MSQEDDFDIKRILVVDDEVPMLRTHGRVLEAHGLRPVLMADPAEALEEAQRRVPSVIIVDLVMPGMSGLEFVTRLRTHFGRSCPPVMLVSANLIQLSPMEQIMFDALFPKPYSIDRYIEWVRKLARQHYERRHAPSEVHLKPGAHWSRPSSAEEED
jgi:CheY-like chemotaxis protein